MSEQADLPLMCPIQSLVPRQEYRAKVIDATWACLADRVRSKEYCTEIFVDSARAAFAAGLYAAAVAVLTEHADYQELTAAAARVDRGK